jgi:hypothetical protein
LFICRLALAVIFIDGRAPMKPGKDSPDLLYPGLSYPISALLHFTPQVGLAMNMKYALSIFVFCLVLPGRVSALAWDTELVHEYKNYEISRSAVAVDQNGYAHVFYGGTHLFHQYFDGTEWKEEVVDPTPQSGYGAIVAIDGNGTFHILYKDLYDNTPYNSQFDSGIKYAHGKQGQWTIESTPFGEHVLQSPSRDASGEIAVDSNGVVHFAYIDNVGSGLGLKHATKASGAGNWSIETVDPEVMSNLESVSIGIDSNNKVHIAYFAGQSSTSLSYANNVSGTWNLESLAEIESYDGLKDFDLALDSQNKIHVCYRTHIPAESEYVLYCMQNSPGGWVSEMVDNGNTGAPENTSAGHSLQLLIDENDALHLAYYLQVGSENKYIRYATNASSTWQFATRALNRLSVDNFVPNLVLGSEVSIFYQPEDFSPFFNEGEIFRARWDGTSWTQDIFAKSAFPVVRNPSSLYVDANNVSHIAYVAGDEVTTYLYYANNEGGVWKSERVGTALTSRTYDESTPAIVVDSAGAVHIIYAGVSPNSNSTYEMTNASGVWQQYLLSGSYQSTKYAAALDASGHIHVAYLTLGSLSGGTGVGWHLRYATNASGSWQEEIAYQIVDEPAYLSPWYDEADLAIDMQVDPSGEIEVAFLREQGSLDLEDMLYLARKSNGSWFVTPMLKKRSLEPLIDTNKPYVDWRLPSVKLDDEGFVHLSYFAYECPFAHNYDLCMPSGLWYSTNKGGRWSHRTLSSEIYEVSPSLPFVVPRNPSVGIGSDGKPRFEYYHDAYQHLRIAKVSSCVSISEVIADNLLYDYEDNEEYIGFAWPLAHESTGELVTSFFVGPNAGLGFGRSADGLSVSAQCSGSSISLTIRNATADSIRIGDVARLGNYRFLTENCKGKTIASGNDCRITLDTSRASPRDYSSAMAMAYTRSGDENSQIIFVGEMFGPGDSDRGDEDSDDSGGGGGGGGGTVDFALLLGLLSLLGLRRRSL